MAKHTAAPWRVVRGNPSPTTGEWMIAGATPGYLAEVRDCGSGDVQSNARLIAAAPELLDALRELDECYCEAGNDLSKEDRHRHRMTLIKARAVIAKATGQCLKGEE